MARPTNTSLHHRAWIALLAAVVCVACASPPSLPDRSAHATMVTLPLGLAGIRDARTQFANLLGTELAAGRSGLGSVAAEWLWDVPATPDRPAEATPPIREAFATRAPATTVLIVPGLFGDCFDTQSVPFGDGVVRERAASLIEAYRQYDDLGLLGVRALAVPGRASSAANGRVVADAIRTEAAKSGVGRIVIVAYSKGVPDALHALALLQSDGGIPPAVVALVSVAGVVMGTPFADHFDAAFRALSPLVSPGDCSPSDGMEVDSVTRRERVAWLAAHPPPARLRYYSIVAHARADEVALALRPVHAAMSAYDLRTDGQLYSSDAILPGSVLLAEARADHWDVALPRDRHPSPAMRALTSGRAYPREALFRAMVKWIVSDGP